LALRGRERDRLALLLQQVGRGQQLLECLLIQLRSCFHRAGYFSQQHSPILISHRFLSRMQLAIQRPGTRAVRIGLAERGRLPAPGSVPKTLKMR
jgi:hypothetical protein